MNKCPFSNCKTKPDWLVFIENTEDEFGKRWQLVDSKVAKNMGWWCKRHARVIRNRLNQCEKSNNHRIHMDEFLKIYKSKS